jgi:hypothetical protein
VERDATGNFSANVITANSYSGSGANLTSLNASSVSSGTLAVANGGTGQTSLTSNNVILGNTTSAVQFVAPGTSSNVLTSNGSTWISQAPSGGGNTGYGDVGTYATLHNTTTTTTYSAGATESGASLSVSCAIRTTTAQTASTTAAPAGTWRVMSNYNNNIANKSLLVGTWLRIA